MAKIICVLRCIILVICMWEGSADCPNGFYRHDDSCYKFFTTMKVTWPEALTMCQLFNAKLAIIDSDREQTFIEGYLRGEFKSGMSDGVWIDGTDAMVEGKWIWMGTGQQITPQSYQKWFPGEPNHLGREGEDCMDLLHHENYNWNDEKCDIYNNFLCEKNVNVNSESGDLMIG